jgi:hypothetical protein
MRIYPRCFSPNPTASSELIMNGRPVLPKELVGLKSDKLLLTGTQSESPAVHPA